MEKMLSTPDRSFPSPIGLPPAFRSPGEYELTPQDLQKVIPPPPGFQFDLSMTSMEEINEDSEYNFIIRKLRTKISKYKMQIHNLTHQVESLDSHKKYSLSQLFDMILSDDETIPRPSCDFKDDHEVQTLKKDLARKDKEIESLRSHIRRSAIEYAESLIEMQKQYDEKLKRIEKKKSLVADLNQCAQTLEVPNISWHERAKVVSKIKDISEDLAKRLLQAKNVKKNIHASLSSIEEIFDSRDNTSEIKSLFLKLPFDLKILFKLF